MTNLVFRHAGSGIGSGEAQRAPAIRLATCVGCASLAALAVLRPGVLPSAPVPVLTDTARVTGYAGVALFVGTLGFWLLVWPSGRSDRNLIRLAWLGLGLVALSGLVGVATTMVGAGFGAEAVPPASTLLFARPAIAMLARLVICAVALMWLRDLARGRGASGAVGVMLVLSLAMTVVAARPGHLEVPAIALTELHVLASAGWVGGLAALAVAVVPRPDPIVLHGILGSFSWLAIACVTTLALTGTAHALLHAGGFQPLITSAYGAALFAKLLAIAGMLGAATGSQAYVRRLQSRPAPVQLIALFIGAELALGAATLVLTAALARAAT
ncbi:CopD family protein [Kribbella sp. NPDC050470]|uniref:CopD family protein n=1 Tax=unclassified Kribbella TaxID=2644121 RepID=UPI00379918B2